MADLSLILPNAEQADETNDKLDQIVTLLAAQTAGNDGSLAVTDFKSIQMLVRMGLADKFFAIGDQITSTKSSSLKVQIGDSTGITAATVTQATFIEKVGTEAGEYRFTYDGLQWLYNDSGVTLSDYGITVTGTAAADDTVLVTQVATEYVWDIIGIDHETPVDTQFTHSLTLGLHNCISVTMQYDSPEALLYVDSSVYSGGLPAGNYAIRAYYSDNNASATTDGYYYFTTTVDIPAGGQIRHSTLGTKTSVDDVVAGTFTTYESGTSNTALESGIATNYASPDDVTVADGVMTYDGTEYTYLGMCTKRAYSRRTIADDENDGTDRSYINYLDRMHYGNNRYSVSIIRQWLNSDAAAGSWYKPSTGLDRCIATYQAYDGFMYNFDPEFLSVLGKVNKTTNLPTCDNAGSAGTEATKDYFFLLSLAEVYGSTSTNEGTAYPYYSDYSDLSAAGTGNDTNRIKYRGTSASDWRLRSPHTAYAHVAYRVSTGGNCNINSAYIAYGIAPACSII